MLDFIFVNIMVIFVLKNGKIVKSIVLMRVIVQCFVRGYAVRVNIKKRINMYLYVRANGHFLHIEMTSDVQRSSADKLVWKINFVEIVKR